MTLIVNIVLINSLEYVFGRLQEPSRTCMDRYTVELFKFEVLRTRDLFRFFSCSNYKEVDIRCITPKTDYYQFFPIKT